MDIFFVKLLMFIVIFLFGFIGGILPGVVGSTKHGDTILPLGSAFAGGVFLGAGTIHLHIINHAFVERETRWSKYIAITMGYGLMALLAIWA
jgi:hypothetical protein